MNDDDIARLAQRMLDRYADDAESECRDRASYYKTLGDSDAEKKWKRVAEAVRNKRR